MSKHEKDRAMKVRDLLNHIISLYDAEDIDDVIIRCSVALAVESVEEYIYDGKQTPSVIPIHDLDGDSRRALVNFIAKSGTDGAGVDGDGLTKEEIVELNNGKKIGAIKLVRDRTKMTLKEAKDLVEAWIEKNPSQYGNP